MIQEILLLWFGTAQIQVLHSFYIFDSKKDTEKADKDRRTPKYLRIIISTEQLKELELFTLKKTVRR